MHYLLEDATEEQRAVITHVDGPAFVSACPGAGKTACITKRIAYLIDQGVHPRNIIGITFTNKAANEMKERVKQLIDPALGRKVWLSTFHSFCVKLMRADTQFYGVRPNFGIADETDSKQLLTLAMAKTLGKSEKEIKAISGTGDIGHVRRWISAQKDLVLTPDELDVLKEREPKRIRFPEFIRYYRAYQQLLRRNNLLDFDDLILQTVLKLQRGREKQEFFAQHLHYLMVDEYQDTNFAQFELIRLISQVRGSVLVVGDLEQCFPGEVEIHTPHGPRRIDSLTEGDEIVCGSGHGTCTTQKIEKVMRRHHEGELVAVKTKSGRTIRATPEHCFFGRLPQSDDGRHYVYMMHKKGVGYRIGRCQSYSSQGRGDRAFGVVCRARQEHADEAWVLRVCGTKEEAVEQEAMLAAGFGIPQVVFHVSGRKLVMTQDSVDKIFAAIDTRKRAKKALDRLGLSIDHPHYSLVAGGANTSRRTVHLRLFGSGKKRRPRHEWFFNSSEMDLMDTAVANGIKAHVTHRTTRQRWGTKTALVDHDEALRGAQHAVEVLGARLDQQAYLTEEGTHQYMPVGNLFVGCRVPVVVEGRVVDDEVVEVSREDYSGYVYDLSIPEYRNYCAEGLLVHNSIYGWRGADTENLKRFYKTFPDTKTYLLQKNFRSVPGIAAAANKVIQYNERLHAKEIVTHKQEGHLPSLVETENTEKEAVWILDTIRNLVKAGRYAWKDFAVIYRIRSLSRSLEDEAVARNMPYRVIGSINFYSRAHIKDILAYLRLLVSPHDDSAFTRIHNKPARGVGPANFSRFAAAAEENDFSLMKTLRKGLYRDVAIGGALSGFRKLKRLYRDLRAIGTNEVTPLVEHIILNSGYQYFAQNIKDDDRSARMQEDLHELVAAASTFDASQIKKKSRGVLGFLEHAALMQRNDKEEDENVVTFLTAHASKGLEFPCVFVRGCVEGILPLMPRGEDGEDALDPQLRRQHFEEERRVFYVAITRAEERLFVSYPMLRNFQGQTINCTPSRFCREAGSTLEFVSMVDKSRPLRANTGGRRRRTHTSSNVRVYRVDIPDGGVGDIMALRERKRRGTATEGDLALLAEEEARRRATVEDA